MATPTRLTRSELAKLFKDQRSIKAFQQVFEILPSDLTTLQNSINSNQLEVGNLISSIDILISELQSVKDDISALMVNTPGNSFGTLAYQSEDQVDISGGVVNAQIKNNQIALLESTTTLTNGAGANTGTLTNSPTTGNPSKWVGIIDNGTVRYIPAW